MRKKTVLIICLAIVQLICAAQNGDISIMLESVHNKRNEMFNETSKQDVTVDAGKLILAGRGFTYVPHHVLALVKDKARLNAVLSEVKDYFLHVASDNNRILKLSYHLIDGGSKGKYLFVHLMRYVAGAQVTRPEIKEIAINLDQLAAEKKRTLEAIKLNVVVDGTKMEHSSVEAVPVFKENDRSTHATSACPS